MLISTTRQSGVLVKKVFHWKKEWTLLAGLVFGLRAVYAGFGFLITQFGLSAPLAEYTYGLIAPYLNKSPFSHYFVNPWFQWDTISYLEISILGYRSNSSAVGYMPLYPMTIRAIAPFTMGDYLFAAILLSTIFLIIALVLFYEITTETYSPEIAWRSVIALLVFPTSFFFLAGYTESLFLALVLGCWYAAQHKHWCWAALLGGLATLTRLQGIVLTPVLVWMVLASNVDDPKVQPWGQMLQVWVSLQTNLKKKEFSSLFPKLLVSLVPFLTFIAYEGWMSFAGFGTVFTALNKYWKIQTVSPWDGFFLFVQRLFTTQFVYSDWIDLVIFIVMIGASLIGLRFLDPSFSIYIWFTIAILFMRGTPPHLLASFSRYLMLLFPVFFLFAQLRGRFVRLLALIVSLSLQLLLGWVFLLGSWVA